jgi:hypothetical protein
MSDRDYPNSGILFKNDHKRDGKDRDYQGTANIDCPHCGKRSTWWLSSWIKQGNKGKFLALNLKVKDADHSARAATAGAPAADEDLPF